MIMSSKNKILLGLFTVASVIILTLGLLFYTLSQTGLNTPNTTSKTSTDFAKTKVEQEAKEVSHFSIFSILKKFIPN
jgi:hypothetical protein